MSNTKAPLSIVQEPSTRSPKLPSASERREAQEVVESKIEKKIVRWTNHKSASKFEPLGSPLRGVKLYALETRAASILISIDEKGNHSMSVLSDKLRIMRRVEMSDEGKTQTTFCGIVSKG